LREKIARIKEVFEVRSPSRSQENMAPNR